MLKLTLKFEVKVKEIIGTREFTEIKNYQITDVYEDSVGIGEIIASSKKVIEAKIKDTFENPEIRCIAIIPEVEEKIETPHIEEPAEIEETDSFVGAINPPEETGNIIEAPEGFEKSVEEVENSPFTNTYYDNDRLSEESKEDSKTTNYDYDEMFEKFLKLSFLTRQNLLIKDFNLLPEEHRGERHKVAFPIAVKVATERKVLEKFYEAINAKSNL